MAVFSMVIHTEDERPGIAIADVLSDFRQAEIWEVISKLRHPTLKKGEHGEVKSAPHSGDAWGRNGTWGTWIYSEDD